jgi:hypothetical protein
MEERFGMAQFSYLLGHTELNWRDGDCHCGKLAAIEPGS